MYKNLHPSATARHGERIGKTSRYRCKQCGFPVDSRKRSNHNPEGVADGMRITGTGADIEINAAAGCPHCGSFNWSDKVSRHIQRAESPGFKPATYRRNYARF